MSRFVAVLESEGAFLFAGLACCAAIALYTLYIVVR